jgi:hypothetical protein
LLGKRDRVLAKGERAHPHMCCNIEEKKEVSTPWRKIEGDLVELRKRALT